MDELSSDGGPYVPVAEKRRQAERELAKLKKRGQSVAPVTIEGRTIAKSFWGKSWCANLERYSDYENRLAARPHLCSQWLRRRPANRKGRSRRDGRRFRALQDQDRHRAGRESALEGHLPRLRRDDRFVG